MSLGSTLKHGLKAPGQRQKKNSKQCSVSSRGSHVHHHNVISVFLNRLSQNRRESVMSNGYTAMPLMSAQAWCAKQHTSLYSEFVLMG